MFVIVGEVIGLPVPMLVPPVGVVYQVYVPPGAEALSDAVLFSQALMAVVVGAAGICQ